MYALHSPILLCRHAFCAHYLIEQGADIYARDKSYRLALHHAAANGRGHVLKVLLDDSMRVATHDGHVALRNARRHGNSCNCRCARGFDLHVVCCHHSTFARCLCEPHLGMSSLSILSLHIC